MCLQLRSSRSSAIVRCRGLLLYDRRSLFSVRRAFFGESGPSWADRPECPACVRPWGLSAPPSSSAAAFVPPLRHCNIFYMLSSRHTQQNAELGSNVATTDVPQHSGPVLVTGSITVRLLSSLKVHMHMIRCGRHQLLLDARTLQHSKLAVCTLRIQPVAYIHRKQDRLINSLLRLELA
jgi:hypothetical protein